VELAARHPPENIHDTPPDRQHVDSHDIGAGDGVEDPAVVLLLKVACAELDRQQVGRGA